MQHSLISTHTTPTCALSKTLYSDLHGPEARLSRSHTRGSQGAAEFRAGIRKRYTDEQILDQLRDCAKALGRSPTMREFERHDGTTVHPQTVIERFGSWNAAKREAGLVPRRFATKAELLQCLRLLGDKISRVPTSKDIDEHRGLVPSKSLYWHTFGSLTNALREAGLTCPWARSGSTGQ